MTSHQGCERVISHRGVVDNNQATRSAHIWQGDVITASAV
eukprot:CAMPEP_0204073582 /NCGR_PEP_ID=MMETSP0360-20130528/163511_1 /ASSEMBLY_ACC=CAM_ASM_000342 /TAXON_ID=268821 /ORGANISM="Scrippsiella Hangoei, Strain SHTV-5" /LENGTH=39 /DNA_ID= /DNA_START= /DNA_END= /DNA_ORIENTATION=